MTNYIDTKEALMILEGRGMKFSRVLFRHYLNTGRAPKGSKKVGCAWLFNPDSVASWMPEQKKKGRKKKNGK